MVGTEIAEKINKEVARKIRLTSGDLWLKLTYRGIVIYLLRSYKSIPLCVNFTGNLGNVKPKKNAKISKKVLVSA